MTPSELAACIDSSALGPLVDQAQIEALCAQAREHNFVAVVVAPLWVRTAKALLKGSDVHLGTVVGFPLGDTLSRVKAFETEQVLDLGADEVDMVLPMAAVKAAQWEQVERHVRAVVHMAAGGLIIKVILETGYLTEVEKIACCRIAQECGADYVKTCTGFGPSGATVEDVRLLRRSVSGDVGVKASGGIRDLATALAMLEAGARRIGTSAGPQLMREFTLQLQNPPESATQGSA